MSTKPQFSTRKCPRSAEFVRAMRETFGEQVEVAALREGEHTYDPEQRLEERDARQAPSAPVR